MHGKKIKTAKQKSIRNKKSLREKIENKEFQKFKYRYLQEN